VTRVARGRERETASDMEAIEKRFSMGLGGVNAKPQATGEQTHKRK
jgi:hypothetical protein